jgi:hypothetical protein
MNLLNILENIQNNMTDKTIIYMAIGSAAHMKYFNEEKKQWEIKSLYEHQYPMFLKKLNILLPFEQMHIILIDPSLEDPPFIVANKTNLNNIDIEWEKDNNDNFHNINNNIHVYPIRMNITYHNDDNNNYYYIYDILKQYNFLSIKYNWFFVFHDYSGIPNYMIASKFDSMLDYHRNHIIYGLDLRDDVGCYVDLTDKKNDFIFYIDKHITIFNPYVYDKNLSFHIDMIKKNDNKLYLIKEFIRIKKNYILNNIISPLRRYNYLMKNKKDNLNNIYENELFYLNNNNNDYENIFNSIYLEAQKELNTYFNMFDMEQNILEEMIKEENNYKWTTIVNSKFKEIEKIEKYNI